MTFETVREWKSFGGVQGVYRHDSECTGTPMELAVYRPQTKTDAPLPVLYFLSGLTCTWENFTVKSGVQRLAAKYGVAIVAPDTSPRGLELPGEHASYDFGSGASFYVDATEVPWRDHYRMHHYVVHELPALVESTFGFDGDRRGIFGHSMGGHGALVAALRHPDRYRSLSAFAPIVAPTRVPWGVKAFRNYLGPDRAQWAAYDACELVATTDWQRPILIDQGDADEFLDSQLKSEWLKEAGDAAGLPIDLRMQPGYDHSYYFVATFLEDHIAHHAGALAT